MVLVTNQVSVLASNALYKQMSKDTAAVLSGNKSNDVLGMSNSDLLVLSTGAMDISRAASFQARSENVASDFESAGNHLNNVQEIVAELHGALAMDDGNAAKNETLRMAADKLLINIATTLASSGRNGKQLFAGTVDQNNIREGINNYDAANNIVTVDNFMTNRSDDDVVALREGDSTNIALKPEDLKDLIGAAQEIKRLATAGNAVPVAVTTVFNNGGEALNAMIGNVKNTYDRASQSVEDQTTKIGSVRDNLQQEMKVDETEIAQKLSDMRNAAQLLQSIMSMRHNFESRMADAAARY